MTHPGFYYRTGEPVHIGDRVRVANRRNGVVEEIALSGTEEAEEHDSETGGVLIAEDWDGVKSYYFAEPDSSPAGWEDVAFAARCPSQDDPMGNRG
jgi:hypothetical protein